MPETAPYTVIRGPLAILGRMVPEGTAVSLHPKQAAAHLRAGALVEGTPAPAPRAKTRARAGAGAPAEEG
ncbi:hypothetical protein [Roseospira goensis]|uniref:Uncharacterized protein n=1 Tax=Roseospira goensis TaxID=391922 RepID=A0A7W6S2Q4_9PROT|nr:hypothetical protein [Roseospira goensis]MBB4287749.1 hypothetical protein [Roseospira goensis]